MKKKIPIGIIALAAVAVVLLSTGNQPRSESRLADIPENAEILFASNRDTGDRRQEIYAMDADGGNVTRITFSSRHHFIMGMDRAGRYIVSSASGQDTALPFGLGDEDRRALWLYDMETKEQKRLTALENKAEGDTFSPDGQWIVFMMSVAGEEQHDIYKIKRDGTNLTKLTDTKNVIEVDLAWSNNGEEIAFSSLEFPSPDERPARFVLKKMDADGENIQTVYDGLPDVKTTGFPPGNFDSSWSRDDEWILFEKPFEFNEENSENFGSGIWHILKVRSDGSQEVVDLSEAGGHADKAEYLPSYSPDGQWIVFGSIYQAEVLQESYSDIFKMDAEGKNVKRLTSAPGSDMMPIWIPIV